jgi:hypothetical protein
MTDHQHPITPPPELVEQWYDAIDNQSTSWKQQLATRAAQWGADQELGACCEWLKDFPRYFIGIEEQLRAARRPKPPSLKEQALEQLGCIQIDLNKFGMGISTDTIRRALEALPND